jgi:hypothetical protein
MPAPSQIPEHQAAALLTPSRRQSKSSLLSRAPKKSPHGLAAWGPIVGSHLQCAQVPGSQTSGGSRSERAGYSNLCLIQLCMNSPGTSCPLALGWSVFLEWTGSHSQLLLCLANMDLWAASMDSCKQAQSAGLRLVPNPAASITPPPAGSGGAACHDSSPPPPSGALSLRNLQSMMGHLGEPIFETGRG